jgi:methylmalonyl-CoA/ethylmalonyl-CoA epimerase
MAYAPGSIGQVSLTVDDVDAAESFYTSALGLKKLFRFGEMLFLDVGGVRLYVQQVATRPFVPASSVLYFRVPELLPARAALEAQGVAFIDTPHLVAAMADHDLWMTLFKDPAGNLMALMCEAPKGWHP